MNQFDINNFTQNPDGTYTKKKSMEQPRELGKKSLARKLLGDVQVNKKFITPEECNKIVCDMQKKIFTSYFKGKNIRDVYEEAIRQGYIFIPGNVPSLKNSKQIFKTKAGKSFITSSDICKEYVKQTKIHWINNRSRFLEMIKGKPLPITLSLFFIRDKHKAFDYGNISQIVLDCITGNAYYPRIRDKEKKKLNDLQRASFAWISDDDADHIIPDYSEGYAYDEKLAGVIIKVK